MKIIKFIGRLFLFFLMTFFFASCKDDSINSSNIDGNWSLVEYVPSAFNPDDNQTFAPGQVVWKFSSDIKQIEVSIQNGVEFNLLDEGTYDYKFGDNGCNYDENLFIIIDERGFGVLIKDKISEGTLIISNACVDGHIMTFTR